MTKRTLLQTLLPFSLLSAALALGVPATLSGCSDGGTSGESPCFDYSEFDGTSKATHFKADVLPILQNSCGLASVCHGVESPSDPAQHFFGPNKDTTATDDQIALIFEQSVGKASVKNPDMQVIKPGDPKASFIMYKLDMVVDGEACETLTCAGDKSCGTEMPQGGPQLEAAKRDTIRRWIAQGAKND
jgi:hypothetical protein